VWHAAASARNRSPASYLLERNADPDHCLFARVYRDDLASAKLLRRCSARLDDTFTVRRR
jgi:hypothetical protein